MGDREMYVIKKWRECYKSFPTCNVDFSRKNVIDKYIKAIDHYTEKWQIDNYFDCIEQHENFFPSLATARKYAGHPTLEDQKQFIAMQVFGFLESRTDMTEPAEKVFEKIGGMQAFINFDCKDSYARKNIRDMVDAVFSPIEHCVTVSDVNQSNLMLTEGEPEKKQ